MTGAPCPSCGRELPSGASLCPACGCDLCTTAGQPPRRSVLGVIAEGGWRLLLYGGLLALPILGFIRLRVTGPGPDLVTTFRWLASGDDGRAAELVTIHRAHEIAAAAARYGLREVEPPSFDDGWSGRLAPYATMNVRGFIPLLFWAASTDLAPPSVREMFEVRAEDGWGRPYRVTAGALPSGPAAAAEPTVAADLARGLQQSFFAAGRPELASGDWFRVELVSAGVDGGFDTPDDLHLVSYFPLSFTLKLDQSREEIQRRLDQTFALGRHYFRVDGSRFDLIEARLLAEFRLESVG